MAPERDTAPGEYLMQWFGTAARKSIEVVGGIANAAKDRVLTMNEGKRLLDQGGDYAPQAIWAKKLACNAVDADEALLQQLQFLAGALSDDAAFSTDPAKHEACSRLAKLYAGAATSLEGGFPAMPTWGSAAEEDAGRIMQFRKAKATIGLAVTHTLGVAGASISSTDSGTKGSRKVVDLEALLKELFRLHDLNANGVLEEDELVKLNEKIAMLHYGKDTDKTVVKDKFKKLFREKLDPNGKPVPYEVFRVYMSEVLEQLDSDPSSQEMILEQFIAEAMSARNAFQFSSFASVSDEPFHFALGIEPQLPSDASGGGGGGSSSVSRASPPTAAPPQSKPTDTATRSSPTSGGGGYVPACISGGGRATASRPSTSSGGGTPAAGNSGGTLIGDGGGSFTSPKNGGSFSPGPCGVGAVGGSGISKSSQSSTASGPAPKPAVATREAVPVARCGCTSGMSKRREELHPPPPPPPPPVPKGKASMDLTMAERVAAAKWRGEWPEAEPRPATAQKRETKAPASGGDKSWEADLSFSKGEIVQAWSNSKNTWLDATVVETFPRPCLSEGYAVPAGTYKVTSVTGLKWVMPEQVPTQLRKKPA
eukprot:TRINITY_DN25367_c0_g1_i1.p1 TRINITY_DN25367_c0_g1~~TRINITY_DN25367_c0_g1_i1.p1  ORF type:complete len:595 (+),score=133.06 TRINITY_DN25367_c0_g1_i1:128-1912(+)